ASSHRVVHIERLGVGLAKLLLQLVVGYAGRSTEHLVLRGGPRLAAGGAWRDRDVRNLAERQVLGKTRGGQPLGRAGEERQERAACRMGTTRAAVEPAGNARGGEGVLEQAEVRVRRAHEDRDLVEARAATGLFQDSSGDFDALAAFARRGEELERAIERTFRRLRGVNRNCRR